MSTLGAPACNGIVRTISPIEEVCEDPFPLDIVLSCITAVSWKTQMISPMTSVQIHSMTISSHVSFSALAIGASIGCRPRLLNDPRVRTRPANLPFYGVLTRFCLSFRFPQVHEGNTLLPRATEPPVPYPLSPNSVMIR